MAFDELLRLAEAEGNTERMAAILLERASYARDRAAAERDLARADALVRPPHPIHGATALWRAQLALAAGEHRAAAAHATAARSSAAAGASPILFARASTVLSAAEEAAGHEAEAYEALLRARVRLHDLLGAEGDALIMPQIRALADRLDGRGQPGGGASSPAPRGGGS